MLFRSRSANSRNRIFVKTEDGIRTEAHDPAKLEDPSLIIYHPVRTMGDALVVTNGDQTDTICQHGVVPDAVIRMSLFTQKQMRRAVISLPMKSSALPAPLLPSRKILDGINRPAGNFADICTDSRNIAQQEEGGKA